MSWQPGPGFNQAEISFSGVDFLTCVFHEYQRRVSLSFSDIITGHATSGDDGCLTTFWTFGTKITDAVQPD